MMCTASRNNVTHRRKGGIVESYFDGVVKTGAAWSSAAAISSLGLAEGPATGMLDAGPNDTRSRIWCAAIEINRSRQPNSQSRKFLCNTAPMRHDTPSIHLASILLALNHAAFYSKSGRGCQRPQLARAVPKRTLFRLREEKTADICPRFKLPDEMGAQAYQRVTGSVVPRYGCRSSSLLCR